MLFLDNCMIVLIGLILIFTETNIKIQYYLPDYLVRHFELFEQLISMITFHEYMKFLLIPKLYSVYSLC